MRTVPELPPGYDYDRSGRRVFIRYNATSKRLKAASTGKPQFWYNEQVAADAAWKHFNNPNKSEYLFQD